VLKAGQGMGMTGIGDAPAEDGKLVKSFLEDGRFLLTCPNACNSLGVGHDAAL